MTSLSTLKWVQQLIWVLVYGGLLTLVLGISVQRTDDALGWTLILGGALVALIGFALVYVRSRLDPDA